MQTIKYQRLINKEREEISRFLSQGISGKEIAEKLGRHRSTIWLEIRRNSGKSGYRAFSSSRQAQRNNTYRRKDKRKITKNPELKAYVIEKLKQNWPPKETSLRLKIEYAVDMDMQISHE